MFFASRKQQAKRRRAARNSRSVRSLHQSASKQYCRLESRQLLAILPPPVLTTNVSDFAHTVDDAIVRVDNQQRLVIRTTGEENRIDLRLDQGFIQINRDSRFSTGLQIDLNQYERIVLISGGDDELRVWGTDLTAQLYPERLWVSGESHSLDGVSGSLILNGNGFEHVEVNDSGQQDFGPLIHQSNNRIRLFGSDGVERLGMNSRNNFSISTSVSLVGDDFQFSANAFGNLYVDGRGGNDLASLAGTRGFNPDSSSLLSANGNDVYTGRDNWSRIQNDQWDARILNFETQRVDLLSGNDSANVADTNRPAWYRVDGSDLVGGFRRLVNIEAIQVTGSDARTEVFVEPAAANAALTATADSYRWTGSIETPPNSPLRLAESFPDSFDWQFESFDRLA